jgi:hypothetical protein
MTLKPDIIEQLRNDFPAGEVDARVAQLIQATSTPRLQRCIVFAGRGHPDHFDYLCRLAQIDFRDLIMAAEYDRFDTQLYDFNRPIPDAALRQE